MPRHIPAFRTALAAAVLFGQFAAPVPPAGAAPQSRRAADPAPAGLSPAVRGGDATPDAADARAGDRHAARGLEDFDARRDPDTGELNAATSLKAAPRDASAAIDALRAAAPGAPDAVRVDLHPSGFAKETINFEGMLSGPFDGTPDEAARAFLARNAELFGLAADAALNVTMENPDEVSGFTFLKYEQTVDGVAVFGSEMSLAVSPKGEVAIATAGQLVQAADTAAKASMSQEEAIAKAFEHCGAPIGAGRLGAPAADKSAGGLAKYANPLDASREDVLAGPSLVNVHGAAVSAYRVYVDKGPSEWYETLVDATSGELLYRRNLYADAHGLVFTETPTAGPRTDEPFAPNTTKFPGVASSDVWLTGTVTTGNNVDAYVDRNADDKPDRDHRGGLRSGHASAADGNFTFTFTSGQDPRGFGAASVTNLFFLNNTMHDWTYSLGFTESARNFQTNNFSRGGSQNDAVRAESQDGSGTNNANFGTPPDGQAPRMQMFLFTMRTPTNLADDRDSSFDADVVFHEYGHGVSNRLIGNGNGLGGRQSDAMGEGWSDYFAVTAFDDPVMGEFVTGNTTVGIRRTAYDARTTAPNGDYAFVGVGGFEVHNDGEVWCQTLVDLRTQLGAPLTDRLVVQGMKVTSTHPSFLNARDGILAADRVLTGGANQCVIWRTFARHGMGVGASGNDGSTHNANYTLPRQCSHDPSDNAQIYTTDGAGNISPLYGYGDWRGSWLTIVPGNFGGSSAVDLLFYDPSAGTGEFYTTDGAGHISLLRTQPSWRTTWDIIVPGDFGGDGYTDLLFYDRESGFAQFYTTDGGGGIHLLRDQPGWDLGWDMIIPGNFGGDGHTDLLFYDRERGLGAFYATDGGGGIQFLKQHTNWRGSWQTIVPGQFGGDGRTDLLFYDRGAGTGEFYTTDGSGGIRLLKTDTSWRTSWDLIVPGDFGGSGYTDLLFYERSSGTGEFWTTDGAGGISLLKTHTNWRGTWYLIVPANFGDSSRTDLLFYQRPS